MQTNDQLTKAARIIVRIAWVANRIFLFAATAGLLLSIILAAQFSGLVARSIPASDLPSAVAGMRMTLLLGIAMAVATDRLFVALAEIIATASTGDPFIAANTSRLRRIGWWLLALQLFDVPGALIARYYSGMGSAAPGADLSFTGWIAVLMTFALARVFAAGSAMRDDLEGTV